MFFRYWHSKNATTLSIIPGFGANTGEEMRKKDTPFPVPEEIIISKIYLFRGEKVMLDSDLADLYKVETRALKQAVRRNMDIFPGHFMFELTEQENVSLRSQTVISKKGRGGVRYLPMVFTGHGILQLANVLRSIRARHMGIRIIEIFIKMREMLRSHHKLLGHIEEIRKSVSRQDDQISLIFEYLGQLEQTKQEELKYRNRKSIGYKHNNGE